MKWENAAAAILTEWISEAAVSSRRCGGRNCYVRLSQLFLKRSGAARPTAKARAILGVAAAAAFTGVFVVMMEVVQPSIVRGASMVPALSDGERIFVERMTASLGSLSRGDVIVLEPPGADGDRYVKRIVGLPGDVIRESLGTLFVNNEIVAEHLNDPNSFTFVVPPDHYFVMGDNYDHSFDSRGFGAVEHARVIGRVIGK
ncbi:MAG: signal peptidase I [Planctomycetota bacterium]